jgi:2OG-Fe(II) oxygenase superfamily
MKHKLLMNVLSISLLLFIPKNSNAMMQPAQTFIKKIFTSAYAVALSQAYKRRAEQCESQQNQQIKVVKPFMHDDAVVALKKVMDKIQRDGRDYDDYAQRRGGIWSDVPVKTSNPEIVQEFLTEKVTLVNGVLNSQRPPSIRDYPEAEEVLCKHVFPKLFEAIGEWEPSLPPTVYAQIFLQRCNTSEAMDWHQDPGEDYDPQANYSLVLMLSKKHDPVHGWQGGEFKVKSGLPEDQTEAMDVKHRYNQGIIFNNQTNSHSVTAVTSPTQKTVRDILVVTLSKEKLPVRKTEV